MDRERASDDLGEPEEGAARPSAGAMRLPTQIATWLRERSLYESTNIDEPPEGEWLYCLRDTRPGDRQIVWSGVHGKGIVGVVDFGQDVREREPEDGGEKKGRYEGWGVFTPLRDPIPVEVVQAHPDLQRRFTGNGLKALLGPIALSREEGLAIDQLAGGLPRAVDPSPADRRMFGGAWSGARLPPERITELIVYDKQRIARKIGFPSRVSRQKTLANGRIPDLRCADGVVGEVKNLVTLRWGPSQLEDYVRQCDRQWPEKAPWRGVLVQGSPMLAPGVAELLQRSVCATRIQLWAITERRIPKWYRARRLFP